MKTSEVNQSLVGKRIKGNLTGLEVTGTIVAIIEECAWPWRPKSEENQVCSKGVRIKLDKPVQWGDSTWTEYESTARVYDEFGNLQFTELLN